MTVSLACVFVPVSEGVNRFHSQNYAHVLETTNRALFRNLVSLHFTSTCQAPITRAEGKATVSGAEENHSQQPRHSRLLCYRYNYT